MVDAAYPCAPMPHAACPHAARLALAFRSCSCRQKAKTGAVAEVAAKLGAGVGLGLWPPAIGLISRTNRTSAASRSQVFAT